MILWLTLSREHTAPPQLLPSITTVITISGSSSSSSSNCRWVFITVIIVILRSTLYICELDYSITWWRHQMETFSALLAICAGNSPVPGEFPTQRPVTRSFGVFFDLRLNKRLSKQSWCWWFETLSSPLWRHRNEADNGLSHHISILCVFHWHANYSRRDSCLQS